MPSPVIVSVGVDCNNNKDGDYDYFNIGFSYSAAILISQLTVTKVDMFDVTIIRMIYCGLLAVTASF